MRLLKLLAVLLILILVALAGYAYFGDMSSDPREMRMPVTLELGVEGTVPPADAPAGTAAENAEEGNAAPDQDAVTGQDDLD